MRRKKHTYKIFSLFFHPSLGSVGIPVSLSLFPQFLFHSKDFSSHGWNAACGCHRCAPSIHPKHPHWLTYRAIPHPYQESSKSKQMSFCMEKKNTSAFMSFVEGYSDPAYNPRESTSALSAFYCWNPFTTQTPPKNQAPQLIGTEATSPALHERGVQSGVFQRVTDPLPLKRSILNLSSCIHFHCPVFWVLLNNKDLQQHWKY